MVDEEAAARIPQIDRHMSQGWSLKEDEALRLRHPREELETVPVKRQPVELEHVDVYLLELLGIRVVFFFTLKRNFAVKVLIVVRSTAKNERLRQI